MDVTVIQLVTNSPSVVVMDSQLGTGVEETNIEVADLTCDGNYQGGSYTYDGLILNGPGMYIKRVKAIHMASFDSAFPEVFGIEIFGPGGIIEN
jgi:hypothetical protein